MGTILVNLSNFKCSVLNTYLLKLNIYNKGSSTFFHF